MIDLEKLKHIYQLPEDLTLSDVNALLQIAKSKMLVANEYFIKQGATKKNIYLIIKGLVRAFTITNKGDEVTVQVWHENRLFASIDNIFFNTPARFYYQAIEPTQVLYLDFELLYSMANKNPKLSGSRTEILHYLLKEEIKQTESFLLLSPEERYLEFIALYPNINNRIPDKYVANLLGITPVSLSRIRKRIASKKK